MIRTIIYYHVIGYKNFNSISYSPSGDFQFENEDYNKNIKVPENIDIKSITNKIDNNEPVVIGFKNFNNKFGHAILGYAYEYWQDGNLKVYIVDSNTKPGDYSTSKPSKKIIDQESYINFENIDGLWYFEYKSNAISGNYASKTNKIYDSDGYEYEQAEPNTEIIIF